jgi:YidC/Oxa1 family membrane protein insertase
MDRNTTTGLILIGAVMVAFFMLNQPPQQHIQEEKAEKQIQKESDIEQKESLEIVVNDTNSNSLSVEDSIIGAKLAEQKEQQRLINEFGVFYKAGIGIEKDFTLKNDKISLAISSKGGSINEAKMIEKSDDGKYKYKTHHDFVNEIEEPLSLFEKNSSTMSLVVEDKENSSLIYTRDLFFESFSSTDSSLILRANAGTADQYLQFTYLLPKGKYDVEFQIDYYNLDNVIDPQVDFEWGMKGLSTEKLADDERMICSIMYRYFGEGRDYMTERSDKEEDIQGTMNWIAFKHKFFSSVLISNEEGFTSGKMVQKQLESDDHTISYYTNVELPSQESISLKFFFGPNDYDLLSAYENEMEDIVNLGWGIFGWVNKFMIGPIFNFIKTWGVGFGLAILLLTLIVKIIIMPLTYKNYVSSAKMKVLKPEITKLNSKYEGKTDKNAAMKKQQETMALYRQTGVNPMAGCIPVLIQMPILFAVFRYFPASLDLRHQGFLWAEDLSSFDSILDLGFEIPFYGDHISLFTLLMAASTLFYTMMNSNQMTPSGPGMPNMKIIMYMFPIMMLFFFNTYSSGLSYYYLCGNVMNMGIMWGIKKYMVDEEKIRAQIEQNKKKPKKKSRFQQRMEDIAKQQQKKKR